jgi:hypothetical protein
VAVETHGATALPPRPAGDAEGESALRVAHRADQHLPDWEPGTGPAGNGDE